MFLGAKSTFLEITPSNARNSMKDEKFTDLKERYKQENRQNKHEVTKRDKLRVFAHLSQIIGLAMLMDQIFLRR